MMLTDSNTPDYQAGFEQGAAAAYALAAGWEMPGFIGYSSLGELGAGAGTSLKVTIIEDGAPSYLKRMLASFEVNDDTLALDVPSVST